MFLICQIHDGSLCLTIIYDESGMELSYLCDLKKWVCKKVKGE